MDSCWRRIDYAGLVGDAFGLTDRLKRSLDFRSLDLLSKLYIHTVSNIKYYCTSQYYCNLKNLFIHIQVTYRKYKYSIFQVHT